MWYETALQELGLEKNLDLNVTLVPHSEDPARSLANVRFMLEKMGQHDGS